MNVVVTPKMTCVDMCAWQAWKLMSEAGVGVLEVASHVCQLD